MSRGAARRRRLATQAIAGLFRLREGGPGSAHPSHQAASTDLSPLGLTADGAHTLVNLLGYPPRILNARVDIVGETGDFCGCLPNRFEGWRQIAIEGVAELFKTAGGAAEFDDGGD